MTYIQVPPDASGGKKILTVETTEGADQVHTQVFALADRIDPTKRIAIDDEGAGTVKYATGSPSFDAFSMMMTSEPNLLGAYKFYEKDEAARFTKLVTGVADATFDVALGGLKLTTGTASGDRVRYLSNRRYAYRPGASNTLLFTMAAGDAGKANLQRCVGWYGDDEFMVFDWDGTDQYVSVRNALTATTTRIIRSNWNGDRLDGSGGDNNRSGATLDATKLSIWWIDYQYLGAGASRFGTWVDGKKVICHTMGRYNAIGRPYLKSPNLAFGMEQVNSGGLVGSSSEMTLPCATVVGSGYPEHPTSTTAFRASFTLTSTSFVPIFSVRAAQLLHGIDNRYRVLPLLFNLVSDTEVVEIIAEFSPTLTGATWGDWVTGVEIDKAATVATPQAGSSAQMGVFAGINVPTIMPLPDLFPPHTDGLHRDWDIAQAQGYFTVSARLMNGVSSQLGVNLSLQIRE